ncbi:myosin-2 heavy chain [Hydra vulgaris]|uniref:myosin-2 heavy chain n=1 Tax=Hydra vulgaris TaxID=6087 RepID=UPI001F5F16BE|nr:myosin-2 heavy chain-like [Hydra vulgaris]
MAENFLIGQNVNVETATFSDAIYIQARNYLETLLANTKDYNAVLEEKLQSHRSLCEKETEEHKCLEENEVKPISTLNIKTSEKEQEVNELKETKQTKRHAVNRDKTTDEKIKTYELRTEQHHREVLMLKNRLKQYQKKLKEKECEESRIKMIFDKERQSFLLDKSNLKNQIDQLSYRLQHEQEMRSHFEKINQEQSLDIINLKSAVKVHLNDKERLEKLLLENEQQVDKIKEYYERHYILKEKVEEYQRDLETKARLDVNKKLQEVNLHLEEQSLAREAFEKIRTEKEIKARKEMEETISQLKMEISSLKTNLFEDLSKKDTSEIQAQRFQTLFKDERNFNDKMNDKLKKTNNLLDIERSRTNTLFEDSMSKISKKLFEDPTNEYKYSTANRKQFSKNSRQNLWSTLMESSTYGKSAERNYKELFERSNLLS